MTEFLKIEAQDLAPSPVARDDLLRPDGRIDEEKHELELEHYRLELERAMDRIMVKNGEANDRVVYDFSRPRRPKG